MEWWMYLIIGAAIMASLFAFFAICGAIFNWMHAGTADYLEVLGIKDPPEDRRYR